MNNSLCKMTAIQIISSENVDDNFRQINEQLASLPKRIEEDNETPTINSQPIHHLVLLPENALCFASREHYLTVAEELGNGPYQTRLSQLAMQYNCTLICGSFPIRSDKENKIYTTSLVYSSQGQLIESYNKIHLFDADVSDAQGAYRESDTFIAGHQVKVIDCGFAKVGLAICYDLRFPGLFQQLRERGAEIILLPAAFTAVTGEAHWQALLQARAIETQCYFIAANQGGEHFSDSADFDTRFTYGHSMIINSWGEVIAKLNTGHGAIQADFDRSTLQTVRKQMPVLQHNRFSSIEKFI